MPVLLVAAEVLLVLVSPTCSVTLLSRPYRPLH